MVPVLSVVIPSHNRPDLLRRCLATVTRHAPPQTEILVVDDGSPGGVVSATARTFGGVGVVQLSARQGFCVAANAGVRAARAFVVELLNDDTEVMPGWADAALARFADPAVAAVAPLVLTWPGGRVDSAGDDYHLGGFARKRGHGETLGLPHLRRAVVFGASASSAFYRREALLRVGAFPEEFRAYFEDVDLAFRLQRAGYRAVFEPSSRVLHHGGASHRPAGGLLEQQSRNEERVFWRNVPACDMALALPMHLAVLLGKSWLRWREGSLLPFLRGRLRVVGEVSAILRHRRRLQRIGPDVPSGRWRVT